MTIKAKTKFLSTRVTPETHKKFHAKSKKFGQPTQVLRDIIEAFNDERLTIQPPVTRKESIYHE
jgi:hypothetical protein